MPSRTPMGRGSAITTQRCAEDDAVSTATEPCLVKGGIGVAEQTLGGGHTWTGQRYASAGAEIPLRSIHDEGLVECRAQTLAETGGVTNVGHRLSSYGEASAG